MLSNPPGYFSDAEDGPRPLTHDDLPAPAWKGITAAFHRFADRDYFAGEFPQQCPDSGTAVAGTNVGGLGDTLEGQIPDLDGWPTTRNQPSTATAMDLVVFGWRFAQEPKATSHHGYFDHDHYEFDRAAGREKWRSEINQILSRNGAALVQQADGTVVRIGSAASAAATRSPVPLTGNTRLDEKVATALRKYADPAPSVRLEALEALWDALEHVKTVLDPGDKKRSVTQLIDAMASGAASRALLDTEFTAVSKIGNDFQIRHHEQSKHPVEPTMVDLLFVRCLALVEAAIRAIAPPQ